MLSPSTGSLRNLWRWFYWLPSDLSVRRKYGRFRSILYYGDSLGDNLLCSAVARELKQRGRGPVAMLTPVGELFYGNPNIEKIFPLDWGEIQALKRVGSPLLRPDYTCPSSDPDRPIPPKNPIIAEMCKSIGMKGEIEMRPECYLSAEEKRKGAMGKRQIAIQSSNSGAMFRSKNKEWPTQRFQEVVHALAQQHELVQLGNASDPLLDGVHDLRNKVTLREAAGIIASSELFIGLEGFLMHLARSVGTRAVIIYGGRVHPNQVGYSCNENLYTPIPCSPCWQFNNCDFERKCLAAISSQQVVEAVRLQLARGDAPLSVDHFIL